VLLTRIALRPPLDAGPDMSAGELSDLLWLNATTHDGIQHIHARTIGGRIEVAVFTLASEQEISDLIVERLCHRALRDVPALRGWSVL